MSIFVIDVHQLLHDCDFAGEYGKDAYHMLSYISFRQDRLRGLKKPHFFVREIMNATHIADERTFRKMRKKCIESGWLRYKTRGKRMPGEYEVVIPDYLSEASNEGNSKALPASDAPNDIGNHAPNSAPNDVPNDVGNNAPNDVGNNAPPSIPIPIPIPNPVPSPNNTPKPPDGASDASVSESASKPRRKKTPKDYSEDFEDFWQRTKYPILKQDTKGDMFKKYQACVKANIDPRDVLFACDAYAELNEGEKFTIGLRRFLNPITLRQYLTEDVRSRTKSAGKSSCDEDFVFREDLTVQEWLGSSSNDEDDDSNSDLLSAGGHL